MSNRNNINKQANKVERNIKPGTSIFQNNKEIFVDVLCSHAFDRDTRKIHAIIPNENIMLLSKMISQ